MCILGLMFNFLARYIQRPTLHLMAHQPTLRRIFSVQASLTYRSARGVTIARRKWGGVPGLEIRPEGVTAAPSLLYLHGGGFTIGSAFTHKWLVAGLARGAGVAAFAPDYRLAPEHPFPAAVDDAEAAFDALAAHGPVAVAGDSAGGCLALGLCASRSPSKALLLSPVVDLDMAQLQQPDAFRDEILLPRSWVRRAVTLYLAGADPADPRVSPIHADLSDAPPMLIQIAKGEALEAHGRRLAERVPSAQLEATENVAHVWQLNAGWQAEADRAVESAARFLSAPV